MRSLIDMCCCENRRNTIFMCHGNNEEIVLIDDLICANDVIICFDRFNTSKFNVSKISRKRWKNKFLAITLN